MFIGKSLSFTDVIFPLLTITAISVGNILNTNRMLRVEKWSIKDKVGGSGPKNFWCNYVFASILPSLVTLGIIFWIGHLVYWQNLNLQLPEWTKF